ncbi:hypothetical protein [Flavicella sediminum]|uniref:hypothetical protein n=1 Tax=Flavicella sediminum TaxID=2585141 RepID=UPI00112308DD|nr:hypothetical protein [Flavicella sediminum]
MIKRILTILLIVFIFNNCTNNKKTVSPILALTDKTEKESIEDNKEISIENIKELISRKWIINTLEYTDKTILFKSYDSNTSDKYTVEFKHNGDLYFEKTKNDIQCLNRNPYLNKAKWEFKKGIYNPETNDFNLVKRILLHIRGGKTLESRFEFKREYRINSISKDTMELEQISSILEKYITDGNNFYDE